MHDWSDKEFDKLSREAADNFSPGRELPDWESLKTRLDDELPVGEEANKRRFIVFLILFLLLGGTGYLLFNYAETAKKKTDILTTIENGGNINSPEKDAESGKDAIQNNKTSAPQTDPATATPNNSRIKGAGTSDNANATDNHPVSAEKQNQSAATKKLSNGTVSPFSLRKKPTNTLVQSAKPGKNKPLPADKNGQGRRADSQKSNNSEGMDVTVESAEIIKQSNDVPVDAGASKVIPQSAPEEAIKDADKKIAAGTVATKESIRADSTTTTKQKSPVQQKAKKTSGIEVGIVAGVDLSNVKFKYNDKAGINIGLTIGYRINKKWSVGTGLIYTKKNYTAEGTDFHPPKGYWTGNYKLDSVQGSCYMLELPVYATYHFGNAKKSGWFVTAGFSTYFMNKEEYTYYYKYMNGSPASRYWKNPDPDNYWFSILGISAGWEKSISPNFTLGISPYAKIPLKGVGFGDMRLSSYGLNLQFTYRKATTRK